MKTLMSVLLSIISVIMAFGGISSQTYFFDTSNLIGLEFLVIAIPSFALALQPNKNRISGSFLSNVFKRCLPGGLTLTIAVMAVFAYKVIAGPAVVSETDYETLLVCVVMFTGIMALVKICQPFNAYRAVLVILTVVLSVVVLTVMMDLFIPVMGETPFGD